MLSNSGSQSVVPGPAGPASFGNLLETQILRPLQELSETKLGGAGVGLTVCFVKTQALPVILMSTHIWDHCSRTVHLRFIPLPLRNKQLGHGGKGKGAAGHKVWDTSWWHQPWLTVPTVTSTVNSELALRAHRPPVVGMERRLFFTQKILVDRWGKRSIL